MDHSNAAKEWKNYRDRELEQCTPLLRSLGFTLEEKQPHISGERYLMQAVTTVNGKKLILLGKRTTDKKRVVIKITSDPAGKEEIRHERTCRKVLHEIKFAYDVFFSPEELLFEERNGYVISIQEFLEQQCQFLDRPLKEQFSLALRALKAQESVHATTYKHRRLVTRVFGERDADAYQAFFDQFRQNLRAYWSDDLPELAPTLAESDRLLSEHARTIEQYSGFLVHVDFVPHNVRIVDGNIYLLDHSSLHFGNKYEGWARFLNFMALYNPELEHALVEYVRQNRSAGEFRSLQLMRVYRLGEIMWYYTNTLSRCTGSLHTLNTKRVVFWMDVLKAVLNGTAVDPDIIETYKRERDALRSDEEKERQRGLH